MPVLNKTVSVCKYGFDRFSIDKEVWTVDLREITEETVRYLICVSPQPVRIKFCTRLLLKGVQKPVPRYTDHALNMLCAYLKQSKIRSILFTNASIVPLELLKPIIDSVQNIELGFVGFNVRIPPNAIDYLIKEMPRFNTLVFDGMHGNVMKTMDKIIQALPGHPNITGLRIKNRDFTNEVYYKLIEVFPRTHLTRLDIGRDDRINFGVDPKLTSRLLDVVHQRQNMTYFAAHGMIQKEHIDKFIQIVRDLPIIEVRKSCLGEFTSWDFIQLAKAAGQNCRLQAIQFGRVFVPVAHEIVKHMGFHPSLDPQSIFTLEYTIPPVFTQEQLRERTLLVTYPERLYKAEYRVLSTLLSAVLVDRVGIKSPIRVMTSTDLFRLLKDMIVTHSV